MRKTQMVMMAEIRSLSSLFRIVKLGYMVAATAYLYIHAECWTMGFRRSSGERKPNGNWVELQRSES
jgi:hypothetical protein